MLPQPPSECLETCMSQVKACHASALSNITNKTGTTLVGLVTMHVKSVEMLIALPFLTHDK